MWPNISCYLFIDIMLQVTNSDPEILDLLDPSSSTSVVGKIYISCSVEVQDKLQVMLLLICCVVRVVDLFEKINRIQLKRKKVLQDGSYL